MSRPIAVRRPSARADRPNVAIGAAIAAGALATGLWLVSATIDDEREDDAGAPAETGPTEATPARPDEAGSAARPSEEPPERRGVGAPAKVPVAPATEPAAEVRRREPASPEPAPAAIAAETPGPAGSLRFRRGRVAYIRCDGVPLQAGPYPCPRDLTLEEQVWGILERVPECPMAPRAPGETDVRIELVPGEPTDVRLLGRPRAGQTELDGPRVLACVRPLANVRSELGASRLLLSFRFSLE